MLNWREIPSFRLLLPFVAGIMLAIQFNFNSTALFLATLLLPGGMWLATKIKGWYRLRWLFGAWLNLYLLGFGYQITWHFNQANHATHFSRKLPQGAAVLAGEVAEAPVRKERWMKIELQVEAVGGLQDSVRAGCGRVLVYLEKDSLAEQVAYGDKLFLRGKIIPAEPPKNPDAFDYSRYLYFQNIHYQAFIRSGEWQLHDRGHGNPIYRKAIALRDHFLLILAKHLPANREFSVASALILGYRDAVPDEVLTAYSETGAMHLLAVSGMHVGFIFAAFHFFLKRIRRRDLAVRILKAVLPLLGIWAFALITGASASVMRATAMFSFIILAQALSRSPNIYNTLAFSAFCLLIYNPYWLLDVGFQLSYVAVLGIVFFEPRITRLWIIKNKIGRFFWQLNAVSLAAQLATLPLTLLYFHQFPVYFWLSSLLLVPVSGGVLILGLVLFFMENLFPVLALGVGIGLWALVWASNEAIFFIQKLPVALIEGIWMSGWMAAALFAALGFGMTAMVARRLLWAAPGLALLLVVAVSMAFTGIEKRKVQQIVIYHVNRHSVVDFLDGHIAHSLVSQEVDPKSVAFAAQNHRFATGVKTVKTFSMNDSLDHATDRWFFKKGFVQFYQTRLAIVDSTFQFSPGRRLQVNYLLVRGSPRLEMKGLLENFDCQQIIFDTSNRRWQVEKWKEECQSLGAPFHDVDEQGAWVLDLKR